MFMRQKGFTLIEMVITILIVAIVTYTAIAAYSSYIKRARRVDATSAIMSISLAEERYRTSNTTYGTLAQVWGGVTSSAEGYYTLALSNVTATSYTITATGTGTQTTDSEGATSCATLTYTMSGGTITKSPAVCWPT